jgi:hypothetical protein
MTSRLSAGSLRLFGRRCPALSLHPSAAYRQQNLSNAQRADHHRLLARCARSFHGSEPDQAVATAALGKVWAIFLLYAIENKTATPQNVAVTGVASASRPHETLKELCDVRL